MLCLTIHKLSAQSDETTSYSMNHPLFNLQFSAMTLKLSAQLDENLGATSFQPSKCNWLIGSYPYTIYTYERGSEKRVLKAFQLFLRNRLVGWFCCFTSQVNSYGYCGTVSSPNHTFSWAGLNKRLTSNLCTYFRL